MSGLSGSIAPAVAPTRWNTAREADKRGFAPPPGERRASPRSSSPRRGLCTAGPTRTRGPNGREIERELELVVPPDVDRRLGKRVVPQLRAGVPVGEVGRVRGDLVGDDPLLDVLPVREPQVFLGGDVAEHRRAVPADHGG